MKTNQTVSEGIRSLLNQLLDEFGPEAGLNQLKEMKDAGEITEHEYISVSNLLRDANEEKNNEHH